MKNHTNSKEVIYKKNNINFLFDKAIKINPKRKSDDIATKSNLRLMNKANSNAETVEESRIKKSQHESSKANTKQQKICIKFKDLVVDSVKSEDSDSHLELALMIKRGKINHHNNSKKKNSKYDNKKSSSKNLKLQKSKSINKIILGINEKENFIKKIKKKLKLCCF